MTGREPDRIPEPSYLPPSPSVGELRAEIDRTRHEAARTVTALTRKLAPSVGTATRYARRVPMPAWIAVVLLLLLWWRRRRTR